MAKSFVMQLASLLTLFVSIPAFVTLVFSIVNLQFPDAADSYWQVESAENGIRYSIAILVIFFPAYLVITRLVNKARRSEGELYHTLTRWLIYLALLLAGLVILGDLATVVFTFLNGEITVRFILKALALLIVITAAFYYYALDAKAYWQKRERISIAIGAAALVFVIAAAVIGYMKIDSPSVAREIRIDQQQISDLQSIQWRVEEYRQINNAFPEDIAAVFTDFPAPIAPEGRQSYAFNVTGAETYELCAAFAAPTPESERGQYKPISVDPSYPYQNDNWEHGAGYKCFERRVVSPQ